jgi:hypothetical protein
VLLSESLGKSIFQRSRAGIWVNVRARIRATPRICLPVSGSLVELAVERCGGQARRGREACLTSPSCRRDVSLHGQVDERAQYRVKKSPLS